MLASLVLRILLMPLALFNTPGVGAGSGGDGGAGTGGGAGSGAGAGSGTGTGGGAPAASTGAPAGSPPAGSGGGTGATGSPGQGQGTVDWATAPAHFRTAYETLQREYTPWREFLSKNEGYDFDRVSNMVSVGQNIIRESFDLGKQLGYSDDQISKALEVDAVHTLAVLRQKAAASGGGVRTAGAGAPGAGNGAGNLTQEQIRALIAEETKGANEFVNTQMAHAANTAFRTEYDRLGGDPQLGFGPEFAKMPAEWKDLTYQALSEVFKYDQKAMEALRTGRDVKSVASHYARVKNTLEAAFQARFKYEMAKAQGAGAGRGAGAGAGAGGGAGAGAGDGSTDGLTLDDVITGTPKAVARFGSMRDGR